MLLRNYDNLMLAKRLFINGKSAAYVQTDKSTFGDGHINAKEYKNGMMREIQVSHEYWRHDPLSAFVEGESLVTSNGYGASALICGGGDTPVTYDDYTLATPFSTSQISNASGTAVITKEYNDADNSWTLTYSRVLNALESVNIKEIGVLSGLPFSSSVTISVLTYRKVLDTPIELQAGDMVRLSFTMTFSANPNKPADYDASATLVE